MNALSEAVAPARVLVLLATYNGAAYLGEQLDSIFAQQGVDVGICYGDDGSQDDTAAVLADYARRFPGRLQPLRSDRRGGRASRNFLRLLVDCEWEGDFDFVALADQDDIWAPDKLRRAVDALRASGALGYSGAVTAFWPDGREKLLGQNPRTRRADFLFEGAGQGCTFVLSPSLLKAVIPVIRQRWDSLDGLHYHDWLVYAFCRASGGDWYFDPQSCMRYRQHAANDTGARSSLAGLVRRLKLVFSGWYSEQIRQMAVFCTEAVPACEPARNYLSLRDLRLRQPVTGRLRLAAFVLRDGRRRMSDRCVLLAMALAGSLR